MIGTNLAKQRLIHAIILEEKKGLHVEELLASGRGSDLAT